jgi:hypothetical protein
MVFMANSPVMAVQDNTIVALIAPPWVAVDARPVQCCRHHLSMTPAAKK